MAYEFILVEKREHLTVVTINRPEVMNSLHPLAHRELDEVFNEFSEDSNSWVAILTATGDRAFCAGNDLRWQAQHGAEELKKSMESLKGGFAGISHRFNLFKPLIAAINGLALGGGFETALACDIIIAADHATFGLPEPRVGLMAGMGGVHRLPRHIPFHLAMGLELTGRHITVQEAYRLGIVNEVVSLKDLMPTAERWAADILACAPLAVRATKEATLKGLDLSLEVAMSKEFPGLETLRYSEDLIEGPKAFAEKRKPKWKGR